MIIPDLMSRIRWQIYLLELENYALGRYFALWPKILGGPKEPLRKPITWTKKMSAVVAVAVIVYALDLLLLERILSAFSLPVPLVSVLVVAAGWALAVWAFFIYLIIAVWLLSPLDALLKRKLVSQAQTALKSRRHPLTVIGITGSYGKTSMKTTLETVLSERLAVLATPDSVNTPLGVASFILESVEEETEVLIVEMGAYGPGDIRSLCELAPPDIAVLTGINEAHLERFGSLATTVSTKFEIVECAKSDALVLLNADDQHVMQHKDQRTSGRHVVTYTWQGASDAAYRAEGVRLDTKRPGIDFVLSGPNGRIGEFATPFLGRYVAGLAAAAAAIGEHMGMSGDELKRGMNNVEPAQHRLQLASRENDILVIDDSYNGNPEGVAEAIWTLQQFTERRRIYVTPGLVEMGEASYEVHRQIGRQLAEAVDVVVLIRNSVTPAIAQGLSEGGFPKEQVRHYDNGPEAFQRLPNMFKAGDVVLFQNDWPPNYS